MNVVENEATGRPRIYPETRMRPEQRRAFNRIHLLARLGEANWSSKKQARRRTALDFIEAKMGLI
ncbi:MAG: hypothetical protein ABSD69_02055 [Candidatus Levyibacteriota bacterium]|jgi:hypothetical protein